MTRLKALLVLCFLLNCSSSQGFEGGATNPPIDLDKTAGKEKGTEALNKSKPIPPPTLEPRPRNVVTKGSFSAWTTPANPQRLENYTITIEVQLPSHITHYQRADLSGSVMGTDGYFQSLEPTTFAKHESFEFLDKIARLHILVPGGEYLVEDEIRIRSNLLSEEQVIHLKFGDAMPISNLIAAAVEEF